MPCHQAYVHHGVLGGSLFLLFSRFWVQILAKAVHRALEAFLACIVV
jgi:hypothetical protein